MLRGFLILGLLALLVRPGVVGAMETAPARTDREIVERLTRLEEGLDGMREAIQQLREDTNRQMQQLREDMNRQMQQLREDMDRQFARHFRLTLALLGAFSALVAAIIGFAWWDRRTMIRPFERRVNSLGRGVASQPVA